MTEVGSDGEQDLDVVTRVAGRVERLADELHSTLGVGDRAVGLAPRRRSGQHDVGELGGLGEEDVLHDQVVEVAQQLDRVIDVGL